MAEFEQPDCEAIFSRPTPLDKLLAFIDAGSEDDVRAEISTPLSGEDPPDLIRAIYRSIEKKNLRMVHMLLESGVKLKML